MRGGERLPGKTPPGHRRWAPVLASLLVLSDLSPLAAADTNPDKLVVVFYPGESDGAPEIVQADRAIRATFADESSGRIELRSECVDTARPHDAEFNQAHASFLRSKYTGRKVDLVMAVTSAGLDFVLERRDELFPGVPVVFLAVGERELASRRLPPGVTGVPIRMDLEGTLGLALRLHPDTRRVFVVAGSAPADVYWEGEARRAFRPYETLAEITYLTGLPVDDLLGRVAVLPEHSIVFYLHVFQDGAGRTWVPANVLGLLAARANAPIYGHVTTYVGRGAVGGRVFDPEADGRRAARLALKVLAGDDLSSVPLPAPTDPADVFDWRELRRWGVPEDRLPPGRVVLFRAPTFWETHRWHAAGLLALCAGEAVLVAALFRHRRRRQRADDRFRRVIETAPTATLLVNRAGTVVTANGRAEEVFGYGRGELPGLSVELLVPARSRGRPPRDRGEDDTAPAFGSVGVGRPLLGRRKDGSAFPVEAGLSPLPAGDDPLVLVSVVDLTERRRMEDQVRASQRELKRLTGRLIEAQEGERRRIARELHDDIDQSLSLLAIELDVSSRRPPESADKMADHLRALSNRVKDLSVAVHDLSRRLHPSKLKHLGLVAAVSGLCSELAHHHGLRVELSHANVPGTLPEAVALCLYRVVQEVLRNVIKHSGTDFARVELDGSPDGLRLRVCDRGVGFDAASARDSDGLGLVSMRERLDLIGGKLEVRSRPGEGTQVDVRVPTTVPDGQGSEGRTDAGG